MTLTLESVIVNDNIVYSLDWISALTFSIILCLSCEIGALRAKYKKFSESKGERERERKELSVCYLARAHLELNSI